VRQNGSRGIIGGTLAAAACLALAAAALATSSNISIAAHDHQGPNGRFTGKVMSSDASCEKRVQVKLHRDRPGGGSHFKVGGRDRTDSQGKWKIAFKGRIPKGTYYATSGRGSCPKVKTTRLKIS
jgi:hypothetical protein